MDRKVSLHSFGFRLDGIHRRNVEHPVLMWVQPFPEKYITAHYGESSEYRIRNKMQPHSGTDWARPSGTPVPAIASGTIRLVTWSSVLGWCVEQTAWDYIRNKTMRIGYAHLTCDKHRDSCGGPKAGCKKPFNVKVGQKVKVGEEFGIKVGNTGSASTGAHLHATLGSRPRAIFAATSAKQNLYCAIQEQSAFAKGQQKN